MRKQKFFIQAANVICLWLFLITGFPVTSAFCYKVCIDPRHGGDQPGCLTHIPGYHEKDINLLVAQALADSLYYSWLLGNYIFTRISDTDISWFDRAKISNDFRVDVFISIHHNSPRDTTDHITQRSESYYSTVLQIPGGDYGSWLRDTTDDLAKKVLYRVRDTFKYPLRG